MNFLDENEKSILNTLTNITVFVLQQTLTCLSRKTSEGEQFEDREVTIW